MADRVKSKPTIKELRVAAGKSQAMVAADLGVSAKTVARIERLVDVPRRWCLAFSAYYGVEPEELAGCEEVAS